MAIEVKCTNCKGRFTLNEEMQRRYDDLRAKHAEWVAFECPLCRLAFLYALAPEKPGKNQAKKQEAHQYRCPVPHCTGWVDSIEDMDERGPFWGCGECGAQWFAVENLWKEIGAIVERYPYRKQCYRKSGKRWLPVPLGKQPRDYEDRVEKEPFEDGERDDYVRG